MKSVEPQCNGGMDKKKPIENQWVMFIFADRTGLEPATSAVTGRHSNQLNYRSKPPKTTFSGRFQDGKDKGKHIS
jgi:hypothetical protein